MTESTKIQSILFVCMGNICRSPMAEGIFNRILQQNKVSEKYQIDSAGLLAYHAGELPDDRMRMHASKRGYKLTHLSRPFSINDFDKFDLIIGMDDSNMSGLRNKARTQEHLDKIKRMTDYCTRYDAKEVPDPYYGGEAGFEYVIDLLEDACGGLYEEIRMKG